MTFPHGFVRVTAASHHLHIADPASNLSALQAALADHRDSGVVVFSELSLSAYSCGDLFAQRPLLDAAAQALVNLADFSHGREQLIVVGLPVRAGSKLYNAAAAVCDGQILGIVPKQHLPNYQEFYEARWFASADGSEPQTLELPGHPTIPFGIDLLFSCGPLVVGIEICEDLWMPIPPSSLQALGGANLLLNLSASNELIGKADYRELLVRSQAGRCLAAYAYASAGPTESSTDVVFGGHCMVAENGAMLAASQRIGQSHCGWLENSAATADIDLQRLARERQVTVSWRQPAEQPPRAYRRIEFSIQHRPDGRRRTVPAHPFVPKNDHELHRRCAEIFGIQCAALAQRVRQLPAQSRLFIGVSGGLDSTLALLVAVKTCQQQAWPVDRIQGITMPGFGTTDRTLQAALQLMQQLRVGSETIDIRQLCLDAFRSLQHRPLGIDATQLSLDEFAAQLRDLPSECRQDLVFENVQARIRTLMLMSRGFVLGTGDLSEQALGWSTYNGDHMSMYNVNTSIPKTLVRFLVKYLAEHEFEGVQRKLLLDIVDTPISPELLPPDKQGQIHQLTENSIGPYELHDFYLYHMLRFGFSPRKLLYLAGLAEFSQPYSAEQLKQTLRTFITRFFANQFKRSCVPDGPKVGTISLSPRGDWRMPSDGDPDAFLRELEP